MNEILVYLYDETGRKEDITLDENIIDNLNDRQLLWINVLKRDEELIKQVTTALHLEKVPIKGILRTLERPKIYTHGDFYHFFIISVEEGEDAHLRSIPIDFLVGKNFVVTIHDGDVNYLQEFTHKNTGENYIGELDAESFVATMLDLHIASYFRVLEKIEKAVDIMDDRILKKNLEDEEFIKHMVKLRNQVSKLRRWFLPHRDIFYSLSRPDFKQIAETDSYDNFQQLNAHFESCVDSIESSRDTVLSLFNLYTTKTSHRINSSMRRLTFITAIVGGTGVIAGVFGMNFEQNFFKNTNAFWVVIGGMLLLALGTTIISLKKRWI
jgi:magnesium/cobalt transport protein CorA